MQDTIQLGTLGILLVASTFSELPNGAQQGIAITVLIMFCAWFMKKQGPQIEKMINAIDGNTATLKDLVESVSSLADACEKSLEDNRQTTRILLEQIGVTKNEIQHS